MPSRGGRPRVRVYTNYRHTPTTAKVIRTLMGTLAVADSDMAVPDCLWGKHATPFLGIKAKGGIENQAVRSGRDIARHTSLLGSAVRCIREPPFRWSGHGTIKAQPGQAVVLSIMFRNKTVIPFRLTGVSTNPRSFILKHASGSGVYRAFRPNGGTAHSPLPAAPGTRGASRGLLPSYPRRTFPSAQVSTSGLPWTTVSRCTGRPQIRSTYARVFSAYGMSSGLPS